MSEFKIIVYSANGSWYEFKTNSQTECNKILLREKKKKDVYWVKLNGKTIYGSPFNG